MTDRSKSTVDVIRGPGVFDMKGGLVQVVLAMKTMLKTSICDPAVTPVIFVNADEEIGSRTSTRFIRRLAQGRESGTRSRARAG